jgi:hypothetical protein
VGKAPRCFSAWTHPVEVSDYEGPHDGDRQQCLRWEMSLLGVELASFAVSHNVLRVGNCRGPVKTL